MGFNEPMNVKLLSPQEFPQDNDHRSLIRRFFFSLGFRNDQNREVSPQQSRRTRAPERAEIEPRNKRNKN